MPDEFDLEELDEFSIELTENVRKLLTLDIHNRDNDYFAKETQEGSNYVLVDCAKKESESRLRLMLFQKHFKIESIVKQKIDLH